MIGKTELLEKLLIQFRFTRPIPAEVRNRIKENKKRQFVLILKKTGGYSLVFGLVASLFFTLKKLGVGITIIKSALILTVSATAAATLITAGIYTSVKYLTQHKNKENACLDITDKKASFTIKDEAEPFLTTDPAAVIAQRIGIQVFTAVNTDKALSPAVTDAIAEELMRLRGKNYTVNIRKSTNTKRYRMMLIGSVEQRGSSLAITARVSDVDDSKILFYASEPVSSADRTDAACKVLARKIAQAFPVKDLPAGNPAR